MIPERISLSGFPLDRIDLDASEVVSLQSFWGGVKIEHTRLDLPKYLLVQPYCFPTTLLEQIRTVGFIPTGKPEDQTSGVLRPFRNGVIIGAIALLICLVIALIYISFQFDEKTTERMIPVVVFGAFLLALSALFSKKVQKRILKPGHSILEVESFFALVLAIAGLIGVTILVFAFFGIG
ncbi:MAG: hypothetical protein KC931_03220 [Candidatus Omnitrophica bacterium]|nr:hypothetical protein [Candidatus Omnitrophota bacterium]